MILHYSHIVNEEFNVKDMKDRRKKVHRITVSYYDSVTMDEYRKYFTGNPKDSIGAIKYPLIIEK